MLIQCMSTTTHSLPNQTFCWSNVAHQIADALPGEYQRCFYTVLNSRPFALKPATIPLHHGSLYLKQFTDFAALMLANAESTVVYAPSTLVRCAKPSKKKQRLGNNCFCLGSLCLLFTKYNLTIKWPLLQANHFCLTNC